MKRYKTIKLPTPIPTVNEDIKFKLINWLYEINLLKQTEIPSLQDKLPKLAKTGVFFADLINRLHGKLEQVIKGISRKPQKKDIPHNWHKVFEYLRQNQRVNSRYLFCELILIE